MYQLKYFQFPRDFKFGVADADLQVIGEGNTLKYENSQPTMWLDFSKTSSLSYNKQTPLEGIDRYHRWREDIDFMKELGVHHYRTSVSMARIMTEDKKPNEKALDWYKKYFHALRKAGISIYATIYHWELPQILSERGGWTNRDIVDYVVEHSKIMHKYLGEYIEEYFILNEPVQATMYSYHIGEQAPGEISLKSGLSAVHNMLLAQGKIANELKSLDSKIKLSTVYNISTTYAASSDPKDILAAKYAYGYHTSMLTDPLFKGEYPEYMLELYQNNMPKIYPGDLELMRVGYLMDSFGVNYYRAKTVKYDPAVDVKFTEVRYPQGVKNGMGRPVYVPPTYSEGLYDLLLELYSKYSNFGMKQIYITENGASWDDMLEANNIVDDEFRIYYLREHLSQVAKAILKGVPVNGYFVWTLMDNYNWTAGYRPESVYGLVYVKHPGLDRIPKKSFSWYKNLIKSHRLD